jgi:PAS domain-containing protein
MTALGLTLTRSGPPPVPPSVPPSEVAPGQQISRLLIPLVRLGQERSRIGEVLTPWCKLVDDSAEPCLVLDPAGCVVAASTAAAELLGEYGPDQVVGHHLLDVVDLVDFHGGTAGAVYADRLPPLLALAGNTLTRGLMRVRFADGATRTLDAVAAPLHHPDGQVAGTIAFLASIWS